MPATGSFDKGAAVEEWTDTIFFRPIGLRIARACMPTRITPDQVTLVALIVGLAAGHLLFYNSVALNAIGVALFIVSDIFDSADGQLARMRGTSTRFGKILDGISDATRFINMYLHLIARLLVGGSAWWIVLPLGVAAGLAHARQSGAVDYIRQLYMYLGEGGRGEFNLPEDMAVIPAANAVKAAELRFYHQYLVSSGRMVSHSLTLVRRLRAEGTVASVGPEWARVQRPVVKQCAWIGQNIRFLLLAITVVPGHPMAFLWITLVPMSCVMIAILRVHEAHARTILGTSAHRLAQAA